MVSLTLLQVGGMYGGVAQVLHLLVPAISVNAWVGVCFAITLALLLGGGYERIERFAIVKVGPVHGADGLRGGDPAAPARRDLACRICSSGFSFELPAAGLATAIAVFGITGVGATELVMYPYWCVEKGYASFAGERDGSAAWEARARGWIRVMHLDILCSLVIYTMATVAFYLLGAGVLNRMGLVPAERDTITVLSNIYTQTLGAVGALALLRRRRRHALRHRLRVDCRQRTPLRRCVSHRRLLRARRRSQPAALAQPLRRDPVGDSGDVLLVPAVARADGRRRRPRAGVDAAAHRQRRHLPATHAAARATFSPRPARRSALDFDGGDGSVRGVLRVVAICRLLCVSRLALLLRVQLRAVSREPLSLHRPNP